MISAAFLILSAIAASPVPHEAMPQHDAHTGASPMIEMRQLRGRIYAQSTIERRVIIRIPMMRRAVPPPPAAQVAPPPPSPHEAEMHGRSWNEHKGPRCIKIKSLRSAGLTSSHGIDLMLRNRQMLRAVLERNCRPADLYSGFYIQPDQDGRLCAGRDRVLARSGANCEIVSLKRLVPEP